MKTYSEEFEAWLKEKYPQVYDLKERYDYESVGYKGRKAAYLAGRASVEKERDELAAALLQSHDQYYGGEGYERALETARRIISHNEDKQRISINGDKEGLK